MTVGDPQRAGRSQRFELFKRGRGVEAVAWSVEPLHPETTATEGNEISTRVRLPIDVGSSHLAAADPQAEGMARRNVGCPIGQDAAFSQRTLACQLNGCHGRLAIIGQRPAKGQAAGQPGSVDVGLPEQGRWLTLWEPEGAPLKLEPQFLDQRCLGPREILGKAENYPEDLAASLAMQEGRRLLMVRFELPIGSLRPDLQRFPGSKRRVGSAIGI